MDLLLSFIDFILNLGDRLPELAANYGTFIYVILFLIVFCETGLVVAPFLPGDSLLFVVGTIAATGVLDIYTATYVLVAAAIIGDNVNYAVGRFIGKRAFTFENSRFFNKDAFLRAHSFFEKHGAKALIMARFVVLLRTFAPFTAGVAAMTYQRFLIIDIIGGMLWVISLTQLGYWCGNIPVVKANFELVILGIIGLSVFPALFAYIKHRKPKTE